ncbi:hypothetical protein NDU88_001150 [Pleurodeles waltl]|uniref:Uncharacterized protein n=1 Tax=Pleurodeles waltl TaxID=8319 RepID=A0AAV7LWT9_PLEWA|nr:hypothetical protein NDU88_001150 [Pleurodeles waltl]
MGPELGQDSRALPRNPRAGTKGWGTGSARPHEPSGGTPGQAPKDGGRAQPGLTSPPEEPQARPQRTGLELSQASREHGGEPNPRSSTKGLGPSSARRHEPSRETPGLTPKDGARAQPGLTSPPEEPQAWPQRMGPELSQASPALRENPRPATIGDSLSPAC